MAQVSRSSSGNGFTQRALETLSPTEVLRQAQEIEPNILQKSIYNSAVKERFFKAPHAERKEMFIECLQSLTPANAFDHTQPRLFSFGHQAIFSVPPQTHTDSFDRSGSKLMALESIIAGHLGSHGIGLLLQLLTELMNERLDLYTHFKVLEIQANIAQARAYPAVPKVTVNLRASDWMLTEVLDAVREAHALVPGRLACEFSEYADDVHFDRFFRAHGNSLSERLEKGLLPLFKQLVEEGIEIWADDVKPVAVYTYEDRDSKTKGVQLKDMHCTHWELMCKPAWREVFTVYKLSIDFIIHAFDISKESGPDFGKVAIHSLSLKWKPEYVSAVTGEDTASSPAQEAEQRVCLQQAALKVFKEMCAELGADLPIVLECTLPGGVLHKAGVEHQENFWEQGALLHEAKLPTSMYIENDWWPSCALL